MHKSAKVAAIYKELRLVAAISSTASEILACAASLVELFSIEDGIPAYELIDGEQPYYMAPVDVALADGGWNTLAREWSDMGWETSDGCGGARPREWVLA